MFVFVGMGEACFLGMVSGGGTARAVELRREWVVLRAGSVTCVGIEDEGDMLASTLCTIHATWYRRPRCDEARCWKAARQCMHVIGPVKWNIFTISGQYSLYIDTSQLQRNPVYGICRTGFHCTLQKQTYETASKAIATAALQVK